MSALSYIDWSIVVLYLVLSLGMGFYLRTKAGENLESYFVAGRKMSGWLVGTSMVATTFAADTPLAVTGIIAKNGIAGNWFWWSLAFSHILAAFVFARLWRRAHIITDAGQDAGPRVRSTGPRTAGRRQRTDSNVPC